MSITTSRQKVNMRVAVTALQDIDNAAKLQGVDRTAFFVEAASTKARQVLLEEKSLRLTKREVEQIRDLLANETDPTEELIAAASQLEELGI